MHLISQDFANFSLKNESWKQILHSSKIKKFRAIHISELVRRCYTMKVNPVLNIHR